MTPSSQKPLLQVLSGSIIKPKPIWLMRQAGRYLPEYRQIRAQAGDFLSLCFTPKFSVEVTLQPIRRFQFDAAIIFSDILVIPHALGQKLWFVESEGPKLEVLDDRVRSSLSNTKIRTKLQTVYEAIAEVKSKLPTQTALIGFAGAPWTVLTYMIAGGSSSESAPARELAYRDPNTFNQLLTLVTEATIEHLLAQVEAGADVLQIFESWAATIPSHRLDQYSISPILQIVNAIRSRHPNIPIIVFPRGAGLGYLKYAQALPTVALSIDTQTSIKSLQGAGLSGRVMQGNLDPLALIAGSAALESAVATLLAETAATPHIVNLGHGIQPSTPIEHVERLITLVRGSS